MTPELENIHITDTQTLISPAALHDEYPLSPRAQAHINQQRENVRAIIEGRDPRLLVVVGPCSIHDVDAATEYAERLLALQPEVADTLLLVMRVYFEKPRSTVGWKGFINDPMLDDSFQIETGLRQARQLLCKLAEQGLATGTEALDPISPQYLGDLFSWSAIGARTTESQTHREMASGLSTPVGFKNGTDGSLEIAINALQSASSPHRFLGINRDGHVAVMVTQGNPHGHVILRGGATPNYDSVSVAQAEQALQAAGHPARLMIDCSHANSKKDHNLQPLVAQNVAQQIAEGNRSIIGLMLEGHLHAGKQPAHPVSAQRYGVSITDACMDWDCTQALLKEISARIRPTRAA